MSVPLAGTTSGRAAAENSARCVGVEDEFAGRLAEAEAQRLPDAAVEVLEPVECCGHLVPAPVVGVHVGLPRGGAVGKRGAGHAGDDGGFGEQARGRRALHADREVDHAHRVFDRRGLQPAALLVLLGASQAGQDQRLPAVHEMTPVQLGADLHGQFALAECGERVWRGGSGEGEVAAHADEHLHITPVHGLDGADGVQAVSAGRFDPACVGEAVEERGGGPVVDAAGSIALHVAVPAHRGRTGSFSSQVPAQQEQVDDLADGVYTVLVLGDAQAPAEDAAIGFAVDAGCAVNLGAVEPGRAIRLGSVPEIDLAAGSALILSPSRSW
ncbi:hypothetical protein [Saccharopolyspora karakumensis]|uniref:hypothetical protein n=1 Tax=Saccharopolyspora karakumensis TaxID=2530386 RepID=UPI001F26864F|nr:hypothetical protein [Saccharopolyspora karakumensis]